MESSRDDFDGENVEYVSEQLDVKGSALEAFSDVFARFQLPPEEHSVCLLSHPFLSRFLWLYSAE